MATSRTKPKPYADNTVTKAPPPKNKQVANPRVPPKNDHILPWEPTDDDLRAIELMAARGLTLDKISSAMGLGAKFLSYRKGMGDIIAVAIIDAMDRGQALGEKAIASSLFNKAEAGDTASQIFFLKSRCGWRENQDLNVFLSTRTKEERDAIVAAAGGEGS